ncbi:zinc finger protein 366-like [Anoplophora glabripennis]|uniref:zinc finger protein 366-like n=1 Tax=Anoplophora glabripennis TaxID=217634 RepID=UPI000874F3B8|nr:zinc finger protein 366-like [Anoplophora glabripennis]
MGDSKGMFCRFCINTASKGNFTVIDESIREILRTVSPNLDLDDNSEHVMCSTCSVKLYSAFDFKSTCLYVEDKIVTYVNPKVSFVDLREVYSKDHEHKPVKVEDNEKICRLCLQLVREGFVPFYKVKLEMIHRYIPEMNFGLTEDPLVCNQCLELLVTHDTFIKACLNVEIKVQNAGEPTITEFKHNNMSIKNETIETGLGDEDKMEGSIKIEQELKMEETPIETEEVNIKSENICESDLPFYNLRNETADDKKEHIYEDVGEIKDESMLKCEIVVDASTLEEVPSCSSEVPGLIDCKKHSTCYQLSKEPSGARMHKCNVCDYETKYKSHLNEHQLSHKDPSEIQMYKCDACSYESRHKGHLKVHQLIHKDPSEIRMYKCYACSYETRYKHSLKYHLLTHKDPSEIHMYKCGTCTFQTKYKHRLKCHQVTHKDRSEIQMYKCDTCSFETKYKGQVKVHQLTHKNSSEIQMFKCEVCTYETKYKSHLKDHQVTHKDPSEICMYRCAICRYETKYKKGLRNHQLLHEKPCTAEISECDTSSTTVDKHYLACHLPVHKGSSNVQVYKCNDCVFETRYKDSLRVHVLLKHEDPSKMPMYKCDKCVFQTRHKHSLVRHQLTHDTVVM